MKIISWNVNGLRSILNKGLQEFIAQEQPDILCLQEIKLQNKHLDTFDNMFPSYDVKYFTAEKPGYSGVATFCSKVRFKSAIEQISGIGIQEFDREARILVSCLNGYTLINAYFPSGTSGDERQQLKYKFLDAFYDFVKPLLEKTSPRLIVLGDFNICHRDVDIHHPREAERRKLTGFLPEERAWLSKFIELGFVDCFRNHHGPEHKKYSWWSYRANARAKNLGWRIDYILVSEDLHDSIKSAELLNETSGSDHCPVLLELNMNNK